MTYWDDVESGIVGKTLTKIEVIDDESILLLHTTDGIYKFTAEGDCCSNSWIEHFDSPTEPCAIKEMKEIEIKPSNDEPTPTIHDHYEEEMQYYFYEIVTDKGAYLIEMRNSSNGYYGGWLEFHGMVI